MCQESGFVREKKVLVFEQADGSLETKRSELARR